MPLVVVVVVFIPPSTPLLSPVPAPLLVLSFDDSSSLFHLSNSDNPGLLLISTSLSGSNFNNWHHTMITTLQAKNKLGFVDGSILKLDDNDDDNLFFATWSRCNIMVISQLLNSVSFEIGHSLLYFNTAVEIWVDLQEQFSQGSGAQIFQLKKDLVNLQ